MDQRRRLLQEVVLHRALSGSSALLQFDVDVGVVELIARWCLLDVKLHHAIVDMESAAHLVPWLEFFTTGWVLEWPVMLMMLAAGDGGDGVEHVIETLVHGRPLPRVDRHPILVALVAVASRTSITAHGTALWHRLLTRADRVMWAALLVVVLITTLSIDWLRWVMTTVAVPVLSTAEHGLTCVGECISVRALRFTLVWIRTAAFGADCHRFVNPAVVHVVVVVAAVSRALVQLLRQSLLLHVVPFVFTSASLISVILERMVLPALVRAKAVLVSGLLRRAVLMISLVMVAVPF